MTGAASFSNTPDVAFRAQRSYVHSTDLYDQIVAGAAKGGLCFDGPIDLKISRVIREVPRYEFVEGDHAGKAAAARCTFASGASTWTCSIAETGVAVTARRPYDESPVRIHSRLGDRCAELTHETGLRPIEALTALAVLLHNSALPPPSGQRWMLARLTLSRALEPADSGHLALQMTKLVGHKLTSTLISDGRSSVGVLMFVLS